MIFDCPGQIELFTDRDIFRELARSLQNYGKHPITKDFR